MDKKTFTLRLSIEQHDILERKANEQGLSKNEYLVRLLEENGKYETILEKLEEIKKLIK